MSLWTPVASIASRDGVLRLTESQHAALLHHLLPGDGLEAVAFLLCGRGGSESGREVLAVQSVHPIPYSECVRRAPDRVTWRTESIVPLLSQAAERDAGLVKIHSHPGGYAAFSEVDDESDRDLFPGIHGWTQTVHPHLSAVMLPGGEIFAREVLADGSFQPWMTVVRAGTQLRFWRLGENLEADRVPLGIAPDVHKRSVQAFGQGTVAQLRKLRVGVVGCSGTGSWVVEMLARLGVGHLVLIDPDYVEQHNLNRIVHASLSHAASKTSKVDVLAAAIQRIELGVTVEPLSIDVRSDQAVHALSQCDVMFGCTDAIGAREVLNRVAVYYQVPLIDVGVRLEADGKGGVEQIVGSVHYVHPESRGFLERQLYTTGQLYAEGLRKSDPASYAEQLSEGYIRGVDEDRPAVASVNALYASLAVNELLARLHEIRDDATPLESLTMSLTQMRVLSIEEDGSTSAYARLVGRGHSRPLLGMTGLSD